MLMDLLYYSNQTAAAAGLNSISLDENKSTWFDFLVFRVNEIFRFCADGHTFHNNKLFLSFFLLHTFCTIQYDTSFLWHVEKQKKQTDKTKKTMD